MNTLRNDLTNDFILDVKHLTHEFPLGKTAAIKAVEDVSFQIRRGEIFGLVGESGSGKSTVAGCVMGLYQPKLGEIFYNGINTCERKLFRQHKKMLQTERQLIFQNAASSLNGKMQVAEIIGEPLQIHRKNLKKERLYEEAAFWLQAVGLSEEYLERYPAELSGGMRQRIAIARALCMQPKLLVADEPIASLDVSIQAQIINLFLQLKKEQGVSMLLIAHDLSVVQYLCDRVGVLYGGKIVELAPTKALFSAPAHPYTKTLLSAIPLPDPRREKKRKFLPFDSASFEREGEMVELSSGHFVWQRRKA